MPPTMTDFAAAFASLAKARSATEALAKDTNAAARQRHEAEIQSQIAEAYGAVMAVHQEHSALLDRVRELESIEATKARYQLVSLGAQNMVAYAPKELEQGEPGHYLCPDCLHAGRISFLQQTQRGPYYNKFVCNTHGELAVDTGAPRQRSALPDRGGGPGSWMGV